MLRAIAVLASLSLGCGRVAFDPVERDGGGSRDAGSAADAGRDGGPPPFDAGTDGGPRPFDVPRAIDGLSGGLAADDPTLRPDLLEIFFNRDSSIMRAARGSTAQPFDPPAAVTELESLALETSPELSSDGLILHFSTSRDGSVDIWIATRATTADPFMNAAPVVELNSSVIDTNPAVTPSGTRVVFSRGSSASQRDLYEATRATSDAPWTTVAPIDELNTSSNDIGPMLAQGGLTIVFCSNRPGALGNDLYIATRASLDEPFGAATPLAEVNTDADEEDPWLSEDGNTLAFSRDGQLYITSR